MKITLIFLFIVFLSNTNAYTNFNLSCTRKINAEELDKFDIYFLKFKKASYSLSTINLQNRQRLNSVNPIDSLNIIHISKQGSQLQFDDIFEVEREDGAHERFFRFMMDSGVANLLVAETEEEVFMERNDGSLKIYNCYFLD